MKLPLVSRKKYEDMVWLKDYWKEQIGYTLEVPYMSIDGIGRIRVFCEDKAQADKIIARLKEKK